MAYIIRDSQGVIIGTRSRPEHEEVNLDHSELLEYFGVPEALRRHGTAFISRDAEGKIIAVKEVPDDEHLSEDHPDVVRFYTDQERDHHKTLLMRQAGAEYDERIPPLEQRRISMLMDGDKAKADAAEVVTEIQEKLAGKTAQVEAATTPEAVQAVRW